MKNNHVKADPRLLIGRLCSKNLLPPLCGSAGRISIRMVRQLEGWTSDELAPSIEFRNSLERAR